MNDIQAQLAANEAGERVCSPGNPERASDDRSRIEHQIEELLSTELDVVVLHNKLFSQDGLFHRLAPTIEERRKQKESSLFRRAKAVVNRRMLAAEAQLRRSLSEAT